MRSPPIHHPAPPPGVAACTSRKCTFWLQLYLPESGYRSPVFLAILETHISGAVELLREFSGRVCKKRSELQHGPPLILGQVLRRGGERPRAPTTTQESSPKALSLRRSLYSMSPKAKRATANSRLRRSSSSSCRSSRSCTRADERMIYRPEANAIAQIKVPGSWSWKVARSHDRSAEWKRS